MNRWMRVTSAAIMGGALFASSNRVDGIRAQGADPAASQTPAVADFQRDLGRVEPYQAYLVEIERRFASRASLVEVLPPLFALAVERTLAGLGPAVLENRAALVAAGIYVNGWPITTLLPEAQSWRRPIRRPVVLRNRGDLAQHFTVSTVLAAAAGSPVADAAGLYKELRDAQGGSGFSFSDLAADRAGTTFGLWATRDEDTARTFQVRAAAVLDEDELMLPLGGLPDNLSDSEFRRRFGGVGAPEYVAFVEDIDQRIAELPIFRIE